MLPLVGPHVKKLLCLLDQFEGRFDHRLWFTNKGDHSAVRGLSGIHIKQTHPFNCIHHGDDGIDLGLVAAFTDIGDTFDQTALHGLSVWAANLVLGGWRLR